MTQRIDKGREDLAGNLGVPREVLQLIADQRLAERPVHGVAHGPGRNQDGHADANPELRSDPEANAGRRGLLPVRCFPTSVAGFQSTFLRATWKWSHSPIGRSGPPSKLRGPVASGGSGQGDARGGNSTIWNQNCSIALTTALNPSRSTGLRMKQLACSE